MPLCPHGQGIESHGLCRPSLQVCVARVVGARPSPPRDQAGARPVRHSPREGGSAPSDQDGVGAPVTKQPPRDPEAPPVPTRARAGPRQGRPSRDRSVSTPPARPHAPGDAATAHGDLEAGGAALRPRGAEAGGRGVSRRGHGGHGVNGPCGQQINGRGRPRREDRRGAGRGARRGGARAESHSRQQRATESAFRRRDRRACQGSTVGNC